MSNSIVLHYHDVVVRQHDLETLGEKQWLNDTIIELHMEYLDRTLHAAEKKILLLRPGLVQLITHIQDATHIESALPSHLEQYRAILVPVNDSQPHRAYSGSHWSLLVFLRSTNTFYYYDSMHETNIADARETARRLAPLLHLTRQPSFTPVDTPQQDNGADCGVYVIAIIDTLAQKMIRQSQLDKSVIELDKKAVARDAKQVRKELRALIRRLQQHAS